MAHIDESDLILHAFDPAAVSGERRRAILEHIAECGACRATHDFFIAADDDLADGEVWEESIGSAARESLAAYAARIAAEDAEAAALLEPLFAAPAKVPWTLHRQRRFLTGGVVRRLNARALELRESEPLEALTYADEAIVIAESLPDNTYPGKAVYELRGKAWEHRASAQMFLGEFGAALESLERAERAHKELAAPAFGLAAVALIRASVYYYQQRFDEAAAQAELAEQAYAHLGDDERRMSALFLRGGIKFENGDLRAAAALFRRIIDYGEAINSVQWIARGANALGNCETERGNLGEASMQFQKAMTIVREIGPINERIATEWGIARVLLRGDKRQEAIRRLRSIASEFEKRGLVTDAALVSLDIADGLLAEGQTQLVVPLAAHVFRIFAEAGMLTGALTAVAYVKETATAGTLTSDDLRFVRIFLRRAERQSELIFLPPPSNR